MHNSKETYLSLDESFFEIAYKCQNNMTSFERLIQHLDQNGRRRDEEVDLYKLQEEAEQLLKYIESKTNTDINHFNTAAIQNNGVLDIQMIVTSIPIKIFVGQVPKMWQESDLKIFFEKHTSITNIEVIRDEKYKHQGCAFVTFSSISDADRVIELYQNKHFPTSKQKIFMKWATGEDERLGVSENSNHRIIIKNLPPLISDKSLTNIFEIFGIIEELKVIRDKTTQECKGHAFIQYCNKESAHLAVQNISSQEIYLRQNSKLKTSFLEKSYQKKKKQIQKHLRKNAMLNQNEPLPANVPFEKYYYEYQNEGEFKPIYYHPHSNKITYDKPPHSSLVWHLDGTCTILPKLFPCHIDFTQEQKKQNNIKYTAQQIIVQGPSFSNVFIFHLPKQFIEKDLYELFSGYGTIISVTVCRKQNGESRGYGFISFNHPYEAAHAIKELNGLSIMGKRIKVELKQTTIEQKKAPSKTLDYMNE